VGFHVSRRFSQIGERVIGVDNFNSYYNPSLKNLRASILSGQFNVKIFHIDLLDADSIINLIKSNNVTGIVHLAAQAGVRIPRMNFTDYISSNVQGFFNVLEAAALLEIPRIFYASSSSVYGNTSGAVSKESQENLAPVSFYGLTKKFNEEMAQLLLNTSNSTSLGLRFFTVYGDYGRPDMAYFRILNALSNQKLFSLYGDGSIRRDFTHIDDVAESIIRLWKVQNIDSHSILNIGGGTPRSMKELIEVFEDQSGKRIMIEHKPEEKSDVNVTHASIEKLESYIGPINFTPIESGIEKLIRWGELPEIKENLEKWINPRASV
jgi:UDP-glucuronate 4-epimerase